ncbi:relaxase/mobilization nuclease domain-containing protein [Runella limosa]|uniref:relaxase/mobilization nuclease domain-containing protein n=1 Tax=Runella limosa TaxID=370978 RepID=UPI000417E7F4|nr:relaxase/mobilization nuclease domain-containing protein [Runella limosa]
MIAKVLGTGKSFSGKIDYLFEGKLEERQAEEKQATIVTYGESLRVPYDYTDSSGIKRMKEDFINHSKSHKNYNNDRGYIGEHVLSFESSDLEKIEGKTDLKGITNEYIKLLGIDASQYVAIAHNDTNHPHVHILFNRLTLDGKKYDDFQEKKRGMYASIVLSQKYGIPLAGSLREKVKDVQVKKMRSTMEDFRNLPKQSILNQAKNFHHLMKLAESQNIPVKDGITVTNVGGTAYRRSDLEVMFWQNRSQNPSQEAKNITPNNQRETQTQEINPINNNTVDGKKEEVKFVSVNILANKSEDGQATNDKKYRVPKAKIPDYKQKIDKLKTTKQIKL